MTAILGFGDDFANYVINGLDFLSDLANVGVCTDTANETLDIRYEQGSLVFKVDLNHSQSLYRAQVISFVIVTLRSSALLSGRCNSKPFGPPEWP